MDTSNFFLLRRCYRLILDIDPESFLSHVGKFSNETINVRSSINWIKIAKHINDLQDQEDLPENAYEEDIDEYGLPVRLYDTPESQIANLLLKKICIQKISQWFEEYFELLKDSDHALEHGVGILELMVRYLSNKLYDLDQEMYQSADKINVEFGNMSRFLIIQIICDNILIMLRSEIFGILLNNMFTNTNAIDAL